MWRWLAIGVVLVSIISYSGKSVMAGSEGTSLFINRANRTLYVLDVAGAVLRTFPCSIGKGGLGQKQSMRDEITPTGDFTVNLLLHQNPAYSAVAPSVIERYRHRPQEEAALVQSRQGLARLFGNMNGIDFDRNGQPDQAYGIAYIGLDSTNAVTGPKLHRFGDTLYWYSIAIHGTPNESTIGTLASGGCVHLRTEDLATLITQRIITVGTKVFIRDLDPPGVSQ